MPPVVIVDVLEFPQRVQEVALVPDERAVQELVLEGLHLAFYDRIHSRYVDAAEVLALGAGGLGSGLGAAGRRL